MTEKNSGLLNIRSNDLLWCDISTAPKDGSRIHLGFRHFQNFDVIGHWAEGEWRLTDKIRLNGRPKSTYWMPLPKAP